jgi:hypothetical protein
MSDYRDMRSERKNSARPIQIFGIVAIFAFMGLLGCEGISTKPVSNACSTAKTASINIYDGQMSRVCGCTEGVGTFNSPSSLQCTVKIGTAIYFNFVDISNSHQITINTSPVQATQPIDQSSSVKTSALVLNQAGTFTFMDNFNAIGGSFIVTP